MVVVRGSSVVVVGFGIDAVGKRGGGRSEEERRAWGAAEGRRGEVGEE